MGALSIANGSDGRIAILNGRDGEVVIQFEAMEGEWWATRMLFGAIQIRGGDTGAAARIWREFVGFGEPKKPAHVDVKIVGSASQRQLVTFHNGTSVFGLYEAAAEALGLQMIDAVRKARGLEPLAIEKWKQVAGYGQAETES